VNKTVEKIVKDAYYDALRDFELKKDQLDFAVKNRASKEHQLSSAKATEALDADRCQEAADKLKDITEFLRSAGLLT